VVDNQAVKEGEGEPAGANPKDRLLHIASALLTVHLEIARQEVADEQIRIARGVAMLAMSWICLFAVALLFQAVVVISLHELLRLSWLWSVILTTAVALLIGLLLRSLGTRQLKAPVLPATRAMMRKTISALRN
jgi:hypothetical protein